MILLAVAGIWFDMPIFAVLAVSMFIWGIFKIAIPTATKIRWAYVNSTFLRPGSVSSFIDPVAARWADGRNADRVQKILPDRNIAEEYKALERGFKRWIVEQEWKIKSSK